MAWDYTKLATTAKKVSDFLSGKGVTAVVKTSRYQTQIKAVEVRHNGTLESLFKQYAINASLTDLTPVEEKSISGKYKAKVVTLNSASAGAAKGDKFFIVNTYTEKGTVKTKELAPEKFGLTTAPYTTTTAFDTAVAKGIKSNKTIPAEIQTAINELYKVVSANTTTRNTIPFSPAAKKAMAQVKPQDRQAIGKDFGEVLSMRWYVSQPFGKSFTKAEFSTISNEALVDFVVTKKVGKEIIPQNISAKFEAGAAPSIGAIIGNVSKVFKSPSGDILAAINVLKALADDNANTSTKILAAMATIKHPAYAALKKVIGKPTFTITDISTHIQKIASINKTPKARIAAFNLAFKDVYTALNKSASDDSVAIVFAGASYKKYYSLIMAPMGYALVEYMNKQAVYQDILNKMSRAMNTEQVYLNFVGENLEFTCKVFSDAKFKFAYGANAKDSDNTGIKFSML